MRICLVLGLFDTAGFEGVGNSLKVLHTYREHGICVVTAVLAQNNRTVHGVYPVPLEQIGAQLESCLEGFKAAAVHVGALPDVQTARLVAGVLQDYQVPLVVLDPILKTGLGYRLHEPPQLADMVNAFRGLLTVLTPNVEEATALIGEPITGVAQAKEAAIRLHEKFQPQYLILKGGHLETAPRAMDIVYDGKRSFVIDQPWIRGRTILGLGDTHATLMAALMAQGLSVQEALDRTKRFIQRAMQHSLVIGAEDAPQPLNFQIPRV